MYLPVSIEVLKHRRWALLTITAFLAAPFLIANSDIAIDGVAMRTNVVGIDYFEVCTVVVMCDLFIGVVN